MLHWNRLSDRVGRSGCELTLSGKPVTLTRGAYVNLNPCVNPLRVKGRQYYNSDAPHTCRQGIDLWLRGVYNRLEHDTEATFRL